MSAKICSWLKDTFNSIVDGILFSCILCSHGKTEPYWLNLSLPWIQF